MESGSECTEDEHKCATLAYNVYLDRLMSYISQYLFKLLQSLPLAEVDGIVFSGGIGEKGARLRQDVLKRLAWLGAEVDNATNEEGTGQVREITSTRSKLRGWVVETDEEGWCAQMTRDEFSL
jgi:acetate kinase